LTFSSPVSFDTAASCLP